MNSSNRKRQHLDHQLPKEEPEEEDGDNDTRSMVGNSEWSFNLEEDNNGTNIGNGNGNELREMELKIAALEAKNQMFESKIENLELKGRLRALTEKNALNELKEENKAIRQKLKEAEEQAQMAKNERDLSPIPTKRPAKTKQAYAKKKATIKKKPARSNQRNSRKKRTNKKKVPPIANNEENQDSFDVLLPITTPQKKVTTLEEMLPLILQRSQLSQLAKHPNFSKLVTGAYVRFLHKYKAIMAEDDELAEQKFKYKIVQILGVQQTGLHSPDDDDFILGWENVVINSKLYSISDSQSTLEEFSEWLNIAKNMAPSLKYVNTKSAIIQKALGQPRIAAFNPSTLFFQHTIWKTFGRQKRLHQHQQQFGGMPQQQSNALPANFPPQSRPAEFGTFVNLENEDNEDEREEQLEM